MRGDAERQANIMLAVTPDSFIPDDHPIRRIKPIVDSALQQLSGLFDTMYATSGRPSIPPEHLLKASLLIALYSIRSERQFCERLRYDLLFKWFLDLNISDEPFDASTFSKNRERLLAADVARAFFAEVVAEAKRRRLLSAEHFTVDGTLLEAWASLKSYRPRDEQEPPPGGRNPDVDFRGRRRSRDTHSSSTDPEARLYTKGSGQTAKLSYLGHLLTENRHGLVLDVELTEANGYAQARGGGHDAGAQRERLRDAGRRPWLRHARLRGGTARARRDAARGAERPPPQQRRGRAYHAASRLAHRQSQKRPSEAPGARSGGHDHEAGGGFTPLLATPRPRKALLRKIVEMLVQVFGWMKTVGGGRKLRFGSWAASATAAGWSSPPPPTTWCAWPGSRLPWRRRSAPSGLYLNPPPGPGALRSTRSQVRRPRSRSRRRLHAASRHSETPEGASSAPC